MRATHAIAAQVDGESHVIHTEENALGTRLVMDTLTCLIAKETDPSRLIAASPGKLTRHLVSSGQHVTAGTPYAEVEVMKMMMPLVSPAAGVLAFAVPEGSVLNSGDLIARLDLDDPAAVTRAVNFTGALPELGPPQVYSDRVDHRFTQACHAARMIMAGELLCLAQDRAVVLTACWLGSIAAQQLLAVTACIVTLSAA